MTKKIFLLILSIISYFLAFLMYVVKPIIIMCNWNFDFVEPNIFCIIFTIISFFLLEIFFSPKRIRFSYFILFFITYVALIIGNNNVFDFTLHKLLNYYERLNMIESKQYELLWNTWCNDLSRNLMYFYAVIYSFLASIFYSILKKIIKLFIKKKY